MNELPDGLSSRNALRIMKQLAEQALFDERMAVLASPKTKWLHDVAKCLGEGWSLKKDEWGEVVGVQNAMGDVISKPKPTNYVDFTEYMCWGTAAMDEPHTLKNVVQGMQSQKLQQDKHIAQLARAPPSVGEGDVALVVEDDAAPRLGAVGDGVVGMVLQEAAAPQPSPAAAPAVAQHAVVEDELLLCKKIMITALENLRSKYNSLTPSEKRAWSCDPTAMLKIVRGLTDRQNVPCAQYFVNAPELWAELDRLNAFKSSTFMQTIPRGFEAVDMSGLTVEERTSRLNVRNVLLMRMLGNRPFMCASVGAMPSKIHGISVQSMMRWIGTACLRHRHLVSLPKSLRPLYCERSLSSDVIELVFAMVQMCCSYKPTKAVMTGCIRNCFYAAQVKAMSRTNSQLSFKRRPKKWYHARSSANDARSWNDGRRMLVGMAAVPCTMLGNRGTHIRRKAENEAKGHNSTIREKFKLGGGDR
jgi:hypothetical protein